MRAAVLDRGRATTAQIALATGVDYRQAYISLCRMVKAGLVTKSRLRAGAGPLLIWEVTDDLIAEHRACVEELFETVGVWQ